ncbi:MAG: hypothetical protein AVDCRST_MAG32-1520, partial [uncultured Nocardioides sp.]
EVRGGDRGGPAPYLAPRLVVAGTAAGAARPRRRGAAAHGRHPGPHRGGLPRPQAGAWRRADPRLRLGRCRRRSSRRGDRGVAVPPAGPYGCAVPRCRQRRGRRLGRLQRGRAGRRARHPRPAPGCRGARTRGARAGGGRRPPRLARHPPTVAPRRGRTAGPGAADQRGAADVRPDTGADLGPSVGGQPHPVGGPGPGRAGRPRLGDARPAGPQARACCRV